MKRTQKELDRLFGLVCDPNDWKAPINALIDPDDEDGVEEAIIHFTATIPDFVPEGDKVRVTAEGYRMGPAGP